MSASIYFDNAATTFIHPEVASEMDRVLRECGGNPSSTHSAGRKSRVVVDECRHKVAEITGAAPSEIFFTSSGTEAINMVLYHAVLSGEVSDIITSPVEHHAVLHTLTYLSGLKPYGLHMLPVDNTGLPCRDSLKKLLSSLTKPMTVLMHANNETGRLLPLREFSELTSRYGSPFLCDTVQSLGKYKVLLGGGGIDFASCSSHKFHGPKGVGFLFMKKGRLIQPLLHGGGQERRLRSGTENISGIAGLTKALEISIRDMESNRQHITALKELTVKLLRQQIPGVVFHAASDKGGLYNLINLSLDPKPSTEMLLEKLDMKGVCVSGGSACSSGAATESYVLKSIGCDTSRPALRISFSRFNTVEEVENFVRILKEITG